MILTAISDSTRLVEYEWTINGVIYEGTTQSIEVDVTKEDDISVRAKNDCGNWSQPLTLKWKEGDMGMLLYIAVFVMAFLMFRSG